MMVLVSEEVTGMFISDDIFRNSAIGMIVWGFILFVSLLFNEAEYGRYSKQTGFCVNNKLAWFIQELPSLVVPTLFVCFTDCYMLAWTCNRILLACFIAHYFHRIFIYPFLLKGKPLPLYMVILAFLFCAVNGFLQTGYLMFIANYPKDWVYHPQFLSGIVMFVLGLVINIQSDRILRNLRKPGETGYKIPRGGMFEYVSGANFFGEMVEWCGFAMASNSLPALAFAISTCGNLGPRAMHHHRWYKNKFEDYPTNRKAVIPFVL